MIIRWQIYSFFYCTIFLWGFFLKKRHGIIFFLHRFQNYKNPNETQFLRRAPIYGVRVLFCHIILRIQ